MKKIYLVGTIFVGMAAHGATTPMGMAIAADGTAPRYLINAADAWYSMIGTPMRAGTIAARMNSIPSADAARLYDVMSVLAFNHTAMTLYTAQAHLNAAYTDADVPLVSRRNSHNRNFVVSAHGNAATDKFRHHKNDDFEMRTGSAGASAYAYVADGLTFGVGYTYAKSKSHKMPVRADGDSNIITLFTKYLSPSGMFLNLALAGGQTQWDIDKTIVGVRDTTQYNTNFYSGQIAGGIKLARGIAFMTPRISARYTWIDTEKHIDAAGQDFKKWWFNSLDINADLRLGLNFATGAMMISPCIHGGGGYDLLNHGTDSISTRLMSGQSYDMPVYSPRRTEWRIGAGVGLEWVRAAVDLTYTMRQRTDYTAHDLRAGAKIAF